MQSRQNICFSIRQLGLRDIFNPSRRINANNAIRLSARCLHRKPNLSTKPSPDPANPETMGENYDPMKLPGNSRLQEYYRDIVAPDVFSMTYNPVPVPVTINEPRFWDGSSPYHENRPARQPKGKKAVLPIEKDRRYNNVPEIDNIVVHTMVKQALQDRSTLLSMAMAFQCMTGIRPQIIPAKKGVAPWKLRPGKNKN